MCMHKCSTWWFVIHVLNTVFTQHSIIIQLNLVILSDGAEKKTSEISEKLEGKILKE